MIYFRILTGEDLLGKIFFRVISVGALQFSVRMSVWARTRECGGEYENTCKCGVEASAARGASGFEK